MKDKLKTLRDPKEIYPVLDRIAEIWANNRLHTLTSIIGPNTEDKSDFETIEYVNGIYDVAKEINAMTKPYE